MFLKNMHQIPGEKSTAQRYVAGLKRIVVRGLNKTPLTHHRKTDLKAHNKN